MYASYGYYETTYLMGRKPKIQEEDFQFWEKQAERVLNQYTFSRLASNLGLITTEVKACTCELAELLYQADKSIQQAAEVDLRNAVTAEEVLSVAWNYA